MKLTGRTSLLASMLGLLALVLVIASATHWAPRRPSPRLAYAASAGARPVDATRAQLEAPPVQVLLYKDVKPGGVTYGYRVVNGSGFPITTLAIGYSQFTDAPELRLAPTGWDGEQTPATSFRAPSNWNFEVTPTEEDSLIFVQWQIDSTATGILGGAALAGFEVTLPQPDTRYETGHWTVYMNSAEESSFTGTIDATGAAAVPPSSIFARSEVRVSPNPTQTGVTIEFSSQASGRCVVDILDAAGRSVRRIHTSLAVVGKQRVVWDGLDGSGRRAPPAAYFIRVQMPTTQRFARFVLEH